MSVNFENTSDNPEARDSGRERERERERERGADELIAGVSPDLVEEKSR